MPKVFFLNKNINTDRTTTHNLPPSIIDMCVYTSGHPEYIDYHMMPNMITNASRTMTSIHTRLI